MIKAAILEYEKETKDIVFLLGQYFRDLDWTFRHYYKASELAKAIRNETYQIFFFDEMFRTPRIESVFIHDCPQAMIVYLCHDPARLQAQETRNRVYYISKTGLEHDMDTIREDLIRQAKQQETYTFVFGSVKLDLPIEDIYYLEKRDKNVYFHTKKGTFHRRLNLADLEQELSVYGFKRVHISYLINEKYLTGIFREEVELNHSMKVPLSRAQKKKLGLKVRHGRQKKADASASAGDE